MSVDRNKTIAEASLDNLHDISLPDAIGFFPLAPGWWMVSWLLLALLFHFLLQRYKQYKKSQYRREALTELGTYTQNNKEHTLALLSLAKRVGIAAYGRKVVAKLSSNDWWDFMEKNSSTKVNRELREEIDRLLYDASYTLSDTSHEKVEKAVSLWIKTHKGQKDV